MATAIEYGPSQCKWTRVECAEWVKSKKCPECKAKRLYPGTEWDRFKISCLNCGWRGRVKPPKEAVHEQPI